MATSAYTLKSATENILPALFLIMGVQAQDFTKEDSGWAAIFNGENFDGLYSRMYGQDVTDEPDPVFQAGDGTIHVDPGGGHLGTDTEYSHYRMRVDYRFGDNTGDNDNGGLMYHVTEDWPRMSDNWPRSIECQMRKKETGDAFSIQQVTYEVPATSAGSRQYEEESTDMTTSPTSHRQRFSLSHLGQNPYVDRQWNTMEIIVRGADSAEHTVNGVSLLKLYNIRIPNPGGAGEAPWGQGKLAVQAENAEISYRNWEIMELPEESPFDYLNKLFVRAPNGGEEWEPGTEQEIAWEHIGEFGTVKLEYTTGNGQWTVIEESTENGGSYAWTVPNDASDQARVRISAEAWVGADESDDVFSIGSGSAVIRNGMRDIITFSIFGICRNYMRQGSFYRVDIYDVTGRLVRSLPVESGNALWDRKNREGLQAGAGLYTVRFVGGRQTENMRFMIL